MTVTGAGAVYNPHWSTIGNIKNWLRKQKEGTVLAAAQPYLHHVAGSEKLIQDWDGVLGEKGGSVLVSAGCLGGGGRVGAGQRAVPRARGVAFLPPPPRPALTLPPSPHPTCPLHPPLPDPL